MSKNQSKPAEAEQEANTPIVYELVGKTRDAIILELATVHKLALPDAQKYYNDNVKGDRKDNLTSTFFGYIRDTDIAEDKVKEFVLANGGSDKTNLSYFKNCAKVMREVREDFKAELAELKGE